MRRSQMTPSKLERWGRYAAAVLPWVLRGRSPEEAVHVACCVADMVTLAEDEPLHTPKPLSGADNSGSTDNTRDP